MITRYIEIQGQRIQADRLRERFCDSYWDNRESVEITCRMGHDEAAAIFTDDQPWQLITVWEDGSEQAADHSEYCVAGDLIDHRDGSMTIKMGKPTDRELLEILMGKTNGGN